MRKTFKKFLSALMVVVMIFTAMPLAGFVGLEFPEFLLQALAEETEKIDYSNITPNQYMSKVLLNYNYTGEASPLNGSEDTIPQTQLKFWLDNSKASTALMLRNELVSNSAFMRSVAAWKVLTFDPKEAYEDLQEETDYYTAILLSILDAQMNDSMFLDAWNCSLNKCILETSENVSGLIKTWYGEYTKDWVNMQYKDFTPEQQEELVAMIKNPFEGYEEGFKLLGIITSSVTTVYELIQVVSAYSQIAGLTDDIKNVLHEIYVNAPAYSPLEIAALKVYEACCENLTTAMIATLEACETIANAGFKFSVGMLWDIALTEILGTAGATFKFAQAIGKSISNFCFSTDAIIEQFYVLNAVTEVEEVMIASVKSLAAKYKANESAANADNFIKSIELLFSVYDLSCDYTLDFAATVINGGLIDKVKSWFGKNETLETYRSATTSIKNTMNFIKKTLTCIESYRWYYQIDAPSAYSKLFELPEEPVISSPPYSKTKEIVNMQPIVHPELDSGAILTYTVTNEKTIIITGCNPSAVGTLQLPKDIGGFAVREIAPYAFANCTGITKITTASTLRKIDYSVFENCSSLSKVTLNEGLKTIGDRAFGGTAITEITIPSTVENLTSTISPAYSAFYGANKLQAVTFAEGMTKIPENALKNNTSVTTVHIPDSVTSINSNAFYGCRNISNILIPKNVTDINIYAFYGCTSLTEITMPENLVTINTSAFSGCSNLSKVTLNEGLKNIGAFSFNGTAITEITIPSTVETMRYNYGSVVSPFETANKLKTVVFAEGMKTIPYAALAKNTSITEVYVPYSVTSISDYAFYGCTALTDVYYGHTEKSWADVTISTYNEPLLNATMHYNHNVKNPTYKASYYLDSDSCIVYNLEKGDTVTQPETPQKTGHTFAGWTPSVPETMPNYDLSFRAIWKVNNYSITFNVDGELYEVYTFSYGREVSTPASPSKVGCIFAGWDGEIPETMPAENLVFNATWVEADSPITVYAVETYIMDTDGTYPVQPDTSDLYSVNSGVIIEVAPEIKTGFEVDTEKSVLSSVVANDGSTVLKVYYSRNIYTLTINSNADTTKLNYYYGSIIATPLDPVVSGREFVGWNPEIPETMPAKDLMITAVFKTSNSDKIKLTIATPSTKTVKYGETLKLYAVASNLPDGATIKWYAEGFGVKLNPSPSGKTCEVTSVSKGNVVIKAVAVDLNGKAITDATGNTVSDTEYLYSEVTLWLMIVAFFRDIFRLDTPVIQSVYNNIF